MKKTIFYTIIIILFLIIIFLCGRSYLALNPETAYLWNSNYELTLNLEKRSMLCMQTANPENNIEYITYNIESVGGENLLENNPLKKTIIKEIYSLEQENEEYYMFLCTVTGNPFLKTKVTIEEIPSGYYPNYSLEKYETNCKKYNGTVTKESSNNHYGYKLLCEFPDGSECDARDFYRRSCLPGNTID